MKIRSITCFFDPKFPLDTESLVHLGKFSAAAGQAFESEGFEVQTRRLASTPLAKILPELEAALAVEFALNLEGTAKAFGIDYISLGPATPEAPESFDLIHPVLSAAQDVFTSGLMTGDGGIAMESVRRCAEAIHRLAAVTADGFTNLRFASLANVPPGTPFFPAAYHSGGPPSFALATEAAGLAVEALDEVASLAAARERLVRQVEDQAERMSRLGSRLAEDWGVTFAGIDFSLAPFPEEADSIGTAFERLGVPAVGQHGSLAAAAVLTEALERATFQRAGFNGLMLPVLEDYTLATRAAEGKLAVKDLLLYSAVCGTGLDTVPLPGDTSVEQIYAVLLDLAALSQRLDKPLTARLMPIPGKAAGDPTGFDFAYFANSRVLRLEAEPLSGPFAGDELLELHPRNPQPSGRQ
jgi:uncharacterized protein (UPF0210 family)